MDRTRVKDLQRVLPPEANEIENILEGKNANADSYSKERLPIINCECGAEILVVPDLKAMNRAIRTHVAEHRRKERKTKSNLITSSKINQVLSQLTLSKLSKMTEQNNT